MSACTLYVHELEIEYVHICFILDLYNVPELIFLHYCHMFHCLVSFNTKIAKTHHSPWTSVPHSLFSFPFFVYSEINVPSQTQSLYHDFSIMFQSWDQILAAVYWSGCLGHSPAVLGLNPHIIVNLLAQDA